MPCVARRAGRLAAAALLSLGLVVLFEQTGGRAQGQAPDALPFSGDYLITGNIRHFDRIPGLQIERALVAARKP